MLNIPTNLKHGGLVWWLKRQADYRDELDQVQRQSPSIAGLIRVAL